MNGLFSWHRNAKPAVLPGLVLGLDLGGSSIRAVLVDHRRSVPILRGIAQRRLSGDQEVGADLRALLDRWSATWTALVVSVEGPHVMIKTVADDLGSEVGDEALKHLVAAQIPFALDDVVVDTCWLRPRTPGLRGRRIIAATRKDHIAQVSAVLASASLTASVIDAGAAALCNAVLFNHPEAFEGLAAVADIGHGQTQLCLLDEGQLAGVADLAVGAPDAEVDRQVMIESIATGLERLSVTRRTGARAAGPGQLFLAGEGSRDAIPDLLADRLEVETRCVNAFANLEVDLQVVSDEPTLDIAPAFAQAVGLALRADALSQ